MAGRRIAAGVAGTTNYVQDDSRQALDIRVPVREAGNYQLRRPQHDLTAFRRSPGAPKEIWVMVAMGIDQVIAEFRVSGGVFSGECEGPLHTANILPENLDLINV